MILFITFLLSFATLFFIAFLCNQQVKFIVFAFKFITFIYDILTYPVYLLIDKPWKIQRHSKTHSADRLYEPNGDYTYWECKKQETEQIIKDERQERIDKTINNLQHLSELLPFAQENYADLKCMGRRKVLRKVIEKGRNKFELSDYEYLTYKQVQEQIDNATKVLHNKFQFKRGDRIAIMADTSLEWFVIFFALQNCGCECVTLHSTLGEDGISHILNSTRVEYLFTQTDLVRLMNKIPNVQTVTKLINIKNQYCDQLSEEEKRNLKYEFYELDKLLKEGQNLPKPKIDKSKFSINDVAVCMFTSGSTGLPKGVLITHFNLIHSARGIVKRMVFDFNLNNQDTFLAYLPMSHIFEMMTEISFFICGVKMSFGKAGTLTNGAPLLAKGCKGDVQASKVTIWTGVPLIFERVQSKIQQLLVDKSPYVAGVYNFAYEYKKKWSARGFKTPLIDAIFFKFIQNQFGGNLKLIVAGGAPIALETQQFIKLYLNVKLVLGYASTECTANGAISAYDQFDHSNTVALMEGIKLRLEDWEEGGYSLHDKPNPRGEIILGTKATSIGYFENEEETEKAFFEENNTRWWRTGDIGEINQYGHLKIIDRKKDLVKLQMGEYISLGKAESVLKMCIYVDNIVLHGDSFHNHLVGLIQPNKEMVIKLAESLGKNVDDDLNKLYEDERIKKEILNELTKYGKSNGLLSKEIPYVIKLCVDNWTPANGLLTASLKTRRVQIYSFYKDSVDKMYQELDSKFSKC